MTDQKTKVLLKVFLDVVCLAVVAIPVLVFYVSGKPYQRGFNCDDESIRYPFKDSTVTNVMLYTYGIGIPLVLIFLVEFINFKQTRVAITAQNYTDFLWTLYNEYVVFVFAALSSQFLTDIAKYSIGRLRPHFISVCRPNRLEQMCASSPYLYIENYECLETNEKLLKEMRLSFMSGHSSFSAVTMVYAAIYLQKRTNWPTITLLRSVFQIMLIYLSVYTGLSRISDYKHHWSDVLVGLLNGTLVAILTHIFVRDTFRKMPLKVRQLSESSQRPVNESASTNYNSCSIELQP